MRLKALFVLGTGCMIGNTAFTQTVVPSGSILANTRWTVAASPYILDGIVLVDNNSILDIEPGVIIRGQPPASAAEFNPGALIIRPGSKIQARGTLSQPVIFTTAAQSMGGGEFSDANQDGIADRWVPANGLGNFHDSDPANNPLPPRTPLFKKNAGLWGGLVIAGNAGTNNGNQTGSVSGAPIVDGYGIVEGLFVSNGGIYGGGRTLGTGITNLNPDHNGGILKYVSLRHGGALLVAGRELNGLTLYACGAKTTISYIDIYSTLDDGIEIFGGSVNVDHININYADDDGFDVDEGWTGTAQFVFVLQGDQYGDNGIELDGEDKIESNGSSPSVPAGDGRMYNFTVLMSTKDDAVIDGTEVSGARVRAGFSGKIVNSIFRNFGSPTTGVGIRIDGLSGVETSPSAIDNFNTGSLQIRNVTVFNFSVEYAPVSGTITLSNNGLVAGTFGGFPIPNQFYPNPLLRVANPQIPVPVHNTYDGINPRPSSSASASAYATPQDPVYVPTPLLATSYRGAFDRSVATLWTSEWTALSKRGVLTK